MTNPVHDQTTSHSEANSLPGEENNAVIQKFQSPIQYTQTYSPSKEACFGASSESETISE